MQKSIHEIECYFPCWIFLTHPCLQLPKLSDNFDISLTKAIYRDYLKENCLPELYLQLKSMTDNTGKLDLQA